MNKEKSFIYFEIEELDEERTTWAVRARRDKSLLGQLAYYARWRGWVFRPAYRTEWSAGCLDEVRTKVVALNEEEKRNRG